MLLQSLTAFLLVSSVAARPIEESSSSVVEPLPIVDSSAAEPIPIVELSSAEDAVSGDRVKLKKLGVGATQCHGSGAFMSRDDVAKGITRFCEEKDGWLTPKNFAPGVWLNVMNLRISNGKEGYLHSKSYHVGENDRSADFSVKFSWISEYTWF